MRSQVGSLEDSRRRTQDAFRTHWRSNNAEHIGTWPQCVEQWEQQLKASTQQMFFVHRQDVFTRERHIKVQQDMPLFYFDYGVLLHES